MLENLNKSREKKVIKEKNLYSYLNQLKKTYKQNLIKTAKVEAIQKEVVYRETIPLTAVTNTRKSKQIIQELTVKNLAKSYEDKNRNGAKYKRVITEKTQQIVQVNGFDMKNDEPVQKQQSKKEPRQEGENMIVEKMIDKAENMRNEKKKDNSNNSSNLSNVANDQDVILTIGISSTALFDLSESNKIFKKEGLKQYSEYQIKNENEVLQKGKAFNLISKLLELNNKYKKNFIEVVLISHNSSDTGLRIFNSIANYKLDIKSAAFCGGREPYRYAQAFNCNLFLSTNYQEAKKAIENDMPAAVISIGSSETNQNKEIKIAFDGDSVLFSDDSDKIYNEKGVKEFIENETTNSDIPLNPGPLKKFLEAIDTIQNYFPSNECPIRTALFTARSAPAHARVVKTLRKWNVRIDESLFLGGKDKVNFLKVFQPDIYFEDKKQIIEKAQKTINTGHVVYGTNNF